MRLTALLVFIFIFSNCSRQTNDAAAESGGSIPEAEDQEVAVSEEVEAAESTLETTEEMSGATGDEAEAVNEDDCIFDVAAQTDDFVKAVSEFKNYTWDDESKMATILLANGDTLYAQRGGCNHFTYSGMLVTKTNQNVMDTAFWLGKGKWMAERIFREADNKLLDRLLKDHSYSSYETDGDLYVNFESHDYSEFYQHTRRKGEWVATEIIFYMD